MARLKADRNTAVEKVIATSVLNTGLDRKVVEVVWTAALRVDVQRDLREANLVMADRRVNLVMVDLAVNRAIVRGQLVAKDVQKATVGPAVRKAKVARSVAKLR